MWSTIASIVGSLLNNSNDSKNTNTVELIQPNTKETNMSSNSNKTNNTVKNSSVENTSSNKTVDNTKSTDAKDKKSSIKDKFSKYGEKMEKIGNILSATSEIANNLPQQQVPQFQNITPTVVSDERLKDIFGEETPIDCFAKIHSYEFKYTPQAQEMMQGKDHVDDKEHLGVMAQELLVNPATSACVFKDTDGFLKVDTAQLTMANTATIAELSRKVQQLEQMLGER